MALKDRDFISLGDFNRKEIEVILRTARKLEPIAAKHRRTTLLKDKVLATLFFEPSTRTRLSFEAAMQRLGGGVIGFADPKTSRAGDWRGETLDDTIKVVNQYVDVIVMRNFIEGTALAAAKAAEVPVINAGDGSNEHPTQALLDLYTILREKGKIDGLTVGLVGDLKNERTFHSMAYGLSNFKVNLVFVHPPGASLPDPIANRIVERGLKTSTASKLEDVISSLDVVYTDTTRKEAFKDSAEFEKFHAAYPHINLKTLEKAKHGMIILHPLPRTDGIDFHVDPAVDSTPYALYFKEVFYGVVTRMAILALVLGAKV
jgi:aspartate carbamoyltransferase catalytic subunit